MLKTLLHYKHPRRRGRGEPRSEFSEEVLSLRALLESLGTPPVYAISLLLPHPPNDDQFCILIINQISGAMFYARRCCCAGFITQSECLSETRVLFRQIYAQLSWAELSLLFFFFPNFSRSKQALNGVYRAPPVKGHLEVATVQCQHNEATRDVEWQGRPPSYGMWQREQDWWCLAANMGRCFWCRIGNFACSG